jgi:hypothetical protein
MGSKFTVHFCSMCSMDENALPVKRRWDASKFLFLNSIKRYI